MRKITVVCLLPVFAFLSACVTPRVAVNPRADFSAIKRVAVISFGGANGELAADLLTQSLVFGGADVVERQKLNSVMNERALTSSTAFDPATAKQLGKLLGVDALFVGTVAESTPQTSYLVSNSNDPIVTSVTQVGNTSLHSEGSVAGMPNSQLLSTTAGVTLIARMVDVQSGSVLWSASMAYEGFDISSAMSGITDAFVNSLTPIWPGLYKIK
jgi:TolB-like protein